MSAAGTIGADGLDLPGMFRYTREHRGTLEGYTEAERISNEALLELDVELLIPAALGGVITAENAAADQSPDHHRRGQRADRARCRRNSRRARHDHSARHSGQCRRRDGQLFRMGPESAALSMGHEPRAAGAGPVLSEGFQTGLGIVGRAEGIACGPPPSCSASAASAGRPCWAALRSRHTPCAVRRGVATALGDCLLHYRLRHSEIACYITDDFEHRGAL